MSLLFDCSLDLGWACWDLFVVLLKCKVVQASPVTLHRFPKKIISDQGPQFAARSMRQILKRIGIDSSLTTAYHPQANGQSEHKNQEVEQYLCLYASRI